MICLKNTKVVMSPPAKDLINFADRRFSKKILINAIILYVSHFC